MDLIRFVLWLCCILGTNALFGYSIQDMQKDIDFLNQKFQNARFHLKSFHTKLKKAQDRIYKLNLLLKQLQQQIPIRETQNHGYIYRYYDDGVLIYQSIDKNRLGIKVGYREKLFQGPGKVSYELADEYRYSTFMEKKVKVHTLQLESFLFWKRASHYGFWKWNPENRKKVYRYSAKDFNNHVIEKVSFLSGKERVFIKKHPLWMLYKIRNKHFYKVFNDGNITMSSSFQQRIFLKKNQAAIHFLIQNWEQTSYVLLLKKLLAKKKKLNLGDFGSVYTFLINQEREKYGLESLRFNKTLYKIARAHRQYLIKNKPKNWHLQSTKGIGYFGRTPFQRRKKYGYPNRVAEKILFGGDDPIYHFVKMYQKSNWLHDFLLNPKAIEVACYQKSHLGVLLIGRKQ